MKEKLTETAISLWSGVEYWKSENYLAKLIQRIHPDAPSSAVFSAAANGSACVRQSICYEQSAASTTASVQPLLLYYAFLNFIKAVLHISDLNYPSGAAVLQHGVSVRRTKRASYHLPAEMVYVYKQGILPSAAERVGLRLPQRIVIGDILGAFPNMMPLIREFYPKYQHLFVLEKDESASSPWMLISRAVASGNAKTVEEWTDDLLESTPDELLAQLRQHWNPTEIAQIAREAPRGYLRLPAIMTAHPWVVRFDKGTVTAGDFATQVGGVDGSSNGDAGEQRVSQFLLLNQPPIPDWVKHFVTLYCLSALTRYSPLEWSDILLWHNEPDALIVEQYLVHARTELRASLFHLFHDVLSALLPMAET